MATTCGISHMFVHSCYSPDVVAHRSVPYPHIPCETKRMLLAVSTHRLCKQCGVDCFHEYTNYAGVFVHAFVLTCAGMGRDSSSLNPKLSQASCAFTDVDVNAGRCRPVRVPPTNYAGVFVHAFVLTCAGMGRDSSSLNPKLSQASCAFTDVDVNAGRCRPVRVPGKQVQLILRLHTYI
jgi:uncharacterized ParB-like nuclease family protein